MRSLRRRWGRFWCRRGRHAYRYGATAARPTPTGFVARSRYVCRYCGDTAWFEDQVEHPTPPDRREQ